jgi:hypothetical protein
MTIDKERERAGTASDACDSSSMRGKWRLVWVRGQSTAPDMRYARGAAARRMLGMSRIRDAVDA